MLKLAVAYLLTLAAAILGFVAQALPSPYSVVLPGGVYELRPRIVLPEDRQRESGWLALTAVRVRKVSYADWLAAHFNPSARIIATTQVQPPDVDDREYYAVRLELMEGSKRTATALAFRRAGYPVTVGGQGALVERVQAIGPSSGKLRAGDVIVALNGQPTSTSGAVGELVRQRTVSDAVRVGVVRGQERLEVEITPVESPAEPGRPLLGIRTSTHLLAVQLPFPATLETRNMVGPSGGLMFTLALLDALTPGDLTGGHRVAGTGAIGIDGRVGAVGSVGSKVLAAEREAADVFLVPRDNADEALRAARAARVVPIGSLDEAVATLQELGGTLGE